MAGLDAATIDLGSGPMPLIHHDPTVVSITKVGARALGCLQNAREDGELELIFGTSFPEDIRHG
jgi:hypothetical protein